MYKVLFLGWEYYPVFTGGLGIVCSAMAENLAEKGIEVYVVLPNPPKEVEFNNITFPKISSDKKFEEYKYSNNVTVKVSKITLDPYLQNTKVKKDTFNELSFDNYRTSSTKRKVEGINLYGSDLVENVHAYANMIEDLIVDIEFDVIHAHDWMTYLGAMRAKEISKKKCILHVHATELDRTNDNPHKYILDLEKYFLNRADKVLAVSDFTRSKLIEKYGVDENKVSTIHNALDERHTFDIEHPLNLGKGKRVMFLGRVVAQKGIDTFIDVASKVISEIPDTTFILAGDGHELQRAIDRVLELEIDKNFIFSGKVDRLHGDILYDSADLFLLTSINEPFGITALEAIKQDTPVVVTKQSGVAEVLPNAISIDHWDTEKFADVVINLLRDEELYKEYRVNQIKDYEKLTWNEQVDKLINIYSEVIDSAHE